MAKYKLLAQDATTGQLKYPESQWLNVKDFGTFTSPTTTLAAFNSAITAGLAVGGQTVYIPSGTYEIDDVLIVPGGVTLVGDGEDKTIIYSQANARILNLVEGSGAYVTLGPKIRNLQIKGSKTAGTNQIGIAADDQTGPDLYMAFTDVSNVRVVTCGGHGVYVGNTFSSRFVNIWSSDHNGYPFLFNCENMPSNHFESLYAGDLNTGFLTGFRVRRGNVTLFSCNGINNNAAGSWWATVGEKSGTDGAALDRSAFLELHNCNIESSKAGGIQLYHNSVLNLIGQNYFVGDSSASGTYQAIKYEINSADYPPTFTKGTIPDKTVFANSENVDIAGTVAINGTGTVTGTGTSFTTALVVGQLIKVNLQIRKITAIANDLSLTVDPAFTGTASSLPLAKYYFAENEVVHANDLPPLMTCGQGIRPTQGTYHSGYYNTTNSRVESLYRSDAFLNRVTVTSTSTFTNPGTRYYELNHTGAITLTLPWPGWYDTPELVIIKDISGSAGTNNVSIAVGGGGTINGGSFTINQNYQCVGLVPNGTTLDWRIIFNYTTAGTGDMLLGTPQTVTGAKTFGTPGGAVGKLIIAGSTSGSTILDATPTAGSGTVTLPTSGTLYGTATGSISSSQLLTSLSDKTGTGVNVFATSPTLVTPVLGVASATSLATSAATPLILTNGQAVNIAVTSQTTGATTLTIPNFASVSDTFAFTTLAQTLSNKTFVAPALGTPASGNLSNCTGTASGLTAGTVTTNANLTGDVTSVGNTTTIGSNKVTLGMLATLAANSVIGNSTGSTATPTAVSMLETATASSVALRDSSANLLANSFIDGFATTATAAGTTTLTVGSKKIQEFTGSTTQTVTLPVVSTLSLGQTFTIINNSLGSVTVNSSGGNLVQTIPANTSATVICVLTSGTTAGSWDSSGVGAAYGPETLSVTDLTTYTATSGTGTTAIRATMTGLTTADILGWDGSNWVNAINQPEWSDITSATNTMSINNGTFGTSITQSIGLWALNWTGNTTTSSLFKLSSNNTSATGYILDVVADSTSSSMKPFRLQARQADVLTTDNAGNLTLSPRTQTGSPGTAFTVTSAAHSGYTGGAEIVDVNFNNARTINRSAGAVSIDRSIRFQGRTLAFASSSTVSDAINVDVETITAGSNATITRSTGLRVKPSAATHHGLWVDGTVSYTGDAAAFGLSGVKIARFVGVNGSMNTTIYDNTALSNSATEGFLYISRMDSSSNPSGTPTATSYQGSSPIVLQNDSSNGRYRFWSYLNSGWRKLGDSIKEEKTWLPTAGVSGTSVGTVWDLPTTSPAVATAVNGTNIHKGVLQFAHTGGSLSAQTTLYLPSDFTGNIDANIIWYSAGTSGNCKWSLATAFTACDATATDDPSFNTASTVTTAVPGTANRIQTSTITSVTATGSGANKLMHLKISRDGSDGSDTLESAVNLVGVEITIRRTI